MRSTRHVRAPFTVAVVNPKDGFMELDWAYSEKTSTVMFAWPRKSGGEEVGEGGNLSRSLEAGNALIRKLNRGGSLPQRSVPRTGPAPITAIGCPSSIYGRAVTVP